MRESSRFDSTSFNSENEAVEPLSIAGQPFPSTEGPETKSAATKEAATNNKEENSLVMMLVYQDRTNILPIYGVRRCTSIEVYVLTTSLLPAIFQRGKLIWKSK